MTQGQRDKLSELVKEFDSIIKPDDHCQIIYLGTPQCEMTLYRELEQRGYNTLVWPARYPRDVKDLESYGLRLAPMLFNEVKENECWWAPTDPVRFDEDNLSERELSYGRAGFALQFMLNPTLSDESRYPLKLRDLIVAPLDLDSAALTYQWLPNPQNEINTLPCVGLKGDKYHRYHVASTSTSSYLQRILVIDPSGRGKDETAYAVLYTLNGYIYLMEVGGMRGGYEDTTLEKLARIAKRWKVNEVVFESNFG
ncbi:UNVERIFIED_CONTAM: phage terminase large subunit, partial [Kocuria sp. CPCC 205274]